MTLQADDTPRVIPLDRLDAILDNDSASQRFYAWMEEITKRIPLEGNGSPENSLEADQGRLYIDKSSSTTGQMIYIKTTTTGSTGWVLA